MVTCRSACNGAGDGDNENASSDGSQSSVSARRRTRIAGVSVSDSGFWVVLQAGNDEYLPIQVTDDSADATSATSPQALTVLQLLASVDMAGAIMPPDVLSRLVVLSCEEKLTATGGGEALTDVEKKVYEEVQSKLYKNATNNAGTYSEQQDVPWLRSRVPLPIATLDEVQLKYDGADNNDGKCTMRYELLCTLRDFGKLRLVPSESIVEQVSYQFATIKGVSSSFMAIALALRYKAPLVLSLQVDAIPTGDESTSTTTTLMSLEQIEAKFPLYRTASQLHQTTERVQKNIERGFEVNQLQAALRLAREKGDDAAAAKIRLKLDEIDSLQDLPTLPETDIGSMQ